MNLINAWDCPKSIADSLSDNISVKRGKLTFFQFVDKTWIPLAVENGEKKPSTVKFNLSMVKLLRKDFPDKEIKRIEPIDIDRYFVYLRTEAKTVRGRQLSSKTIKHVYGTLYSIFRYAKKYKVIKENPMEEVKPPKNPKTQVSAVSHSELKILLQKLEYEPLDFRCMVRVLLTTGIRRGECLGLQWGDVDAETMTLHIRRNVIYTPESGTTIQTPKTENSIRDIPIFEDTMQLLRQYKEQVQQQHPEADLQKAFLFPSRSSIYKAKSPDAVTSRLKRFMERAGLPHYSPHVLRHTCATFLISSGADTKSVQTIMGHSTASTTLNFYVKPDETKQREVIDLFRGLPS